MQRMFYDVMRCVAKRGRSEIPLVDAVTDGSAGFAGMSVILFSFCEYFIRVSTVCTCGLCGNLGARCISRVLLFLFSFLLLTLLFF